MSKLVIFRGDAVENETHLAGPTLRIGRDNRNDIVLDDKSVSRFHAEVRADGDRYCIVDLKSRNGVWVNGQQIKGKAALALGVPVTLGAYELALEDDVSTGAFGDEAPHSSQHTVVNAASVDQADRPSATRGPMRSPVAARKRQALWWSVAAVATVLVCIATYAVVRNMDQPAIVAEVTTPPPVEIPPATPPPEDPTRATIERHLAAARAAMESRDYVAVLGEHLPPVLELDPGNQEAIELKRLADEAVAATRQPSPPRVVVKKPELPTEVETPGIARRADEAWADYTARVQRIQVNFQEGNRSLERQDFPLAIVRFQLVDRDQKGYQGVDGLLTETVARQRREADQAIGYGQQNEQGNNRPDALRWYQRAQAIDPASAIARDRIAGLTERLTKDGLDAFTKAEVFRKRNDYGRALESYKQAADLLPRSHEKSREALEWLEKLKP